MVQKYSGKIDTSEEKEKKYIYKETRVAFRAHVYRRTKNDWTKDRGLGESKYTKTKQKKTNVPLKKDDMSSANQTPGGYKFASLVASQLWRANQHEHASFEMSSPWMFPSRSGILLHAVVQAAAIYFAINGSAPCSTVLHHFPSSWAAAVHWSALMSESLRCLGNIPSTHFPAPPRSPRPPPFFRTYAYRQSCILHARQGFCGQDLPPA